MDFKEVLFILIGIIVLVWVLSTLNTFVSGTPLLMYVGSMAVFGILAIVLGAFFTYYVYSNYTN